MQFIDLKAQQIPIREKIEKRIKKVLDHGRYIMGPEISELEEKLADFAGVAHAVGTASGTDALLMGLMALGVGPGDAVFTSPFTFIATAEVIQLLGATPVFVDIDENTFNMDPVLLEQAIKDLLDRNQQGTCTLKPRGIMPVDLFGQPADYAAINVIAQKYGLFVLEDAAQSFGASAEGKPACSLAEIAGTSFFPAKPLGAYGDGGMVFTDDAQLREHLVSIRVHGKGSHKYENVRIGVNGRLDTIQAAILLAKFEIFPAEINQRQVVAQRYAAGLKDCVQVPVVKAGMRSAWAQYSVLHDKRDFMCAQLKEMGIPTAIYYPKPLHIQPAFFDLGYKKGDFPVSEKMADRIFSLPFHPYLLEDEQKKIIAAVHEADRQAG